MLGDQPCGFGAVIPRKLGRWPPYRDDDRIQLPRVRFVYGLHFGMVAVKQAAVFRKTFPYLKIMGRKGNETIR